MSRSTWVWIILGIALLTTGGMALATVSPAVKKISEAIAYAEGFNLPNSRPQRNNNPGDIEADLIHKAIGYDGPFPIYATPEDGWENLYTQVSRMLSGTSGKYSPSESISQIAHTYAGKGWYDWANNVANYLGVSTDTTLEQIT